MELLDTVSEFNMSTEALITAARCFHSEQGIWSRKPGRLLKPKLIRLLARKQNIETRDWYLLRKFADWNDEMMAMLLDRDPSIRVSDEDLLAAAQNGGGVMAAILLVGGHKMTITEQVLLSVARYHKDSVMKKLLARDRNIIITDKFLGHCGPQMCEILLARDPNILITEESLLGALERKDYETIEVLLAHDRNLQVTEVSLLLAFGIYFVDAFITILLPRATGIEITEGLLIAALEALYDYSDCASTTIHTLLMARGPDARISEAVVVAAVRMDGVQTLMKILLSHDPNILTTDAVMVAAAGNDFVGKEMVEVLLSRNPDINISAEAMTAAIKNHGFGKELIMVLLERDLNIEIAEDWGVRLEMVAARTFGSEWVTIVIPKNPNIPAALIVVKRDFRDNVTSIQLFRGSDIKITETVMAAAANNWDYSTRGIKMLLGRYPNIAVTEVALRNAATDPECDKDLLEMLLARDPNIKLTEAPVVAYADNRHSDAQVIDRPA